MRKGLFWVIPNDDGKQLVAFHVLCDQNGLVAAGQSAYNSKKGNSFSHERTWELLAQNLPKNARNKPWNYFPRGRVEIASDKAAVYYNPVIWEWPGFETAVYREFELDGLPVRFIADYSRHYRAEINTE